MQPASTGAPRDQATRPDTTSDDWRLLLHLRKNIVGVNCYCGKHVPSSLRVRKLIDEVIRKRVLALSSRKTLIMIERLVMIDIARDHRLSLTACFVSFSLGYRVVNDTGARLYVMRRRCEQMHCGSRCTSPCHRHHSDSQPRTTVAAAALLFDFANEGCRTDFRGAD